MSALALWGAGWTLQISNAGTKPTKTYEEMQGQTAAPQSLDPELKQLRDAAAASPSNIESQQRFARVLLQKIRSAPVPPAGLILEATDVLTAILKLDPINTDALISLADLSFNQRVFDKAAQLYQRYLNELPEDHAARSRYASSLAFVGKTDEAIAELQRVLAKDPKNFHALAYLSIAYAQVGDNAQAQEAGRKALQVAPTQEARARFLEFLNSLGGTTSEQQASSQAGTKVDDFARLVAQNPVAGPKYVGYETPSSTEIVILLRSFPMQNMPPFAKAKFFSGLQEKAKSIGLTGYKRVIFKDADTGQVLDGMDLPG